MKTRFTLTCNKCGKEGDIDSASEGYWDDGYKLTCECGNFAHDIGETFPIPIDPVKKYHIDKGCCDGSDPSGCYNRQLQIAADERIRARAEARRIAMNEYHGTEPSEGDQVFCPSNKNHASQKMGDKCPYCGWVA